MFAVPKPPPRRPILRLRVRRLVAVCRQPTRRSDACVLRHAASLLGLGCLGDAKGAAHVEPCNLRPENFTGSESASLGVAIDRSPGVGFAAELRCVRHGSIRAHVVLRVK